MRRVGILTEIFREYHSLNKRNSCSLKASLRLVVYFPWFTVEFSGCFIFLKQARAEHDVTTM